MRTVRVRYSTAEGTHAWWNSLDLFGADEQGGPLKPVILFVGGGGWQGLDHVNEHQKIAADAGHIRRVVAWGYLSADSDELPADSLRSAQHPRL